MTHGCLRKPQRCGAEWREVTTSAEQEQTIFSPKERRKRKGKVVSSTAAAETEANAWRSEASQSPELRFEVLMDEIADLEVSELAALLGDSTEVSLETDESSQISPVEDGSFISIFLQFCVDWCATPSFDADLDLQLYGIIDEEFDLLSDDQQTRWENAEEEERQGLWRATKQLCGSDMMVQQRPCQPHHM